MWTKYARPLGQAALIERLRARDQDRAVRVEGLSRRRGVGESRYCDPAPLEIGQEVGRVSAGRGVDVAAVAGAEADDGATASRDSHRPVEPVVRVAVGVGHS